MNYHVVPDIPPELRRPVSYDNECRHFTRKFENWPDEPKRGDRVEYRCGECGRKKVMTI